MQSFIIKAAVVRIWAPYLQYWLIICHLFTNSMAQIKVWVSKILIIVAIFYHIWITLSDATQQKRFEINSTNNVHKYFSPGTWAYRFLFAYSQEVTLIMMASSIFMLFSRALVFKAVAIVGVVVYNFLILHFHMIFANFYALREWLAILGGIVALIAIDIECLKKETKKNVTQSAILNRQPKETKTQ